MAKLGKALMSLFLDKKAREALERKAPAPKAGRPAQTVPGGQAAPPQAPQASQPPMTRPAEPHPSREELFARLSEAADTQAKRQASPDRRNLIQGALKVRAQKAKMLDDLPREERLKLQAMARLAFLRSKG